MLRKKLKAKKCKYRECRASFQPETEWQKYCCIKHRSAAAYRRAADLVRKAERIIEAQERERTKAA